VHEERGPPRLQALAWPDKGLLHVPREELVYLSLSCAVRKGVLVSSLHLIYPPWDLLLVCLDDVGSGDKWQDIEQVQEDLPVLVSDAEELHFHLLHESAQ
jgi:hypothetical protein